MEQSLNAKKHRKNRIFTLIIFLLFIMLSFILFSKGIINAKYFLLTIALAFVGLLIGWSKELDFIAEEDTNKKTLAFRKLTIIAVIVSLVTSFIGLLFGLYKYQKFLLDIILYPIGSIILYLLVSHLIKIGEKRHDR